MKLTNRYGIASCIGIQALCIPLLYSFSLSAPVVASLEGTPPAERLSGDSSGLASGIEGVVVRSTGAIEAPRNSPNSIREPAMSVRDS